MAASSKVTHEISQVQSRVALLAVRAARLGGTLYEPRKKKKGPFDQIDQTLNFSKVSSKEHQASRDQPSNPSQQRRESQRKDRTCGIDHEALNSLSTITSIAGGHHQ
jgi:hypothetical protein